MKEYISGLFLLISIFAQAQTLPLTGDLRVHDPVMIKHDSTYYIFSTGRNISIKSSTDRLHWKNEGSVFNEQQAWWKIDIPEHDGHIWAPDIHYRNGKYHLYYSVSAWMNFNSSIGYATNTTLNPKDPEYKWIDHGKVIDFRNGGEGVNCIDPQIHVEENGRVLMFYGSYKAGLRVVELDAETGLLKSENPPLTVVTPSLGEGVFVIKTDDWYYIFASRGICCKGLESNYQMVTGRAKQAEGPYLNKNGESWLDNQYSLFLAGDYAEPGRGHNGFFTENDTTFIVYHAYDRAHEGKSMLRIAPVYLDENDWPSFTPTGRILSAKQQSSNNIYDAKLAKQLGADDYGMKSYYLVILKTGKNKNKDKAAISKAFAGHMQNIKSLAAEGKLIVAGPISKNRKNYRGIFILNAVNETEVMEMLLADAAIREKYLEPEIYKWYGSAALPLYLEKSAKISKKSF